MNEKTLSELAKMIDHSVLHPVATDKDLQRECELAKTYHVASVCVKPYAVKQASEMLKGSDVRVGCVIGFPAGNSSIPVKVYEAGQAIQDGASEVDMVINIGKALGGDWKYIEEEIGAVTAICHKQGVLVKVIFETDYITKTDDKIRLCDICTRCNVDYVKTSTGFGFVKQAGNGYSYRGASIADVTLMRNHSGPDIIVKASGGLRTLDDVLAAKDAGADRIGTSATKSILEEAGARFS